jgi:hypothetical protein
MDKTPSTPVSVPHPSKVRNEDGGVKPRPCELIVPGGPKDILGTGDKDAGERLLIQVLRTIRGCDETNAERYVKPVLPILRGIGPKDELEGLLAAQMVGVHYVAMDFLSAASRRDCSMEASDRYLNGAVKLLRTFTAQMEALNRYREKVSQQMTVENVNVTEGGQAIVGQVSHRGPGKVSAADEEKNRAG